MKLVAKVLIAALLISQSIIAPANSAIAGSACTKIGAKKKTTKNTYICSKVGKKRIWVKVVKPATPAPVPSPTPTPTPTPTPISTPTPTPTQTPSKSADYLSADKAKLGVDCLFKGESAATLEGPVVCDGVWSLITQEEDSVASRAYRYVLEEYNSKSAGNLSIVWRIDPETPDWKNKMQTGMNAGARLWGTSPAGSPERYAYVSHNPDWLFEQFKKDGLIKNESRRETMFQGPCNAALTGADGSDTTFWFYKFSDESCQLSVGFYQVPAHEYTHYAQEVLSNKGWTRVQRVPWLDEGLASFVGGAMGPMSEMRNDLRAFWARDVARVSKDLSFFNRGVSEVYQDKAWGDVYPLGAIAVEAMVAAIGFRNTKQIYIELSTPNTTYEQAITKVTGVNIAGWNTILQGYIDSVKADKPWGLDFLLQEYAKKKA